MLGLPLDFGSAKPPQWRMAHIVSTLIAVFMFAMAGGLYLWRLHHFPHTIATIEAVWEQEVHRRGRDIVTMADLSFTRTSQAGEAVPCRHSFEIGTPSDGFRVGDKLEIVPATGTCQRINIIGRSQPIP